VGQGTKPFVSRAGLKLDHALTTFQIDVTDKICADLGSNTGGFVDCLLRRGAKKVYAIDTGYGVLDWKLRNDPRVVVMERTNAIHATLREPVQIVTIDVAWTRQQVILPAAARMLDFDGHVITLIKPQYEAMEKWVRKGVLLPDHVQDVIASVQRTIVACGFELAGITQSPIKGAKGNVEFLAHLTRAHPSG
jgi:23S rRNA (cytidine1920-2'-O)/16S rRNA (cytidine1409-2'-O)-methyltransferase